MRPLHVSSLACALALWVSCTGTHTPAPSGTTPPRPQTKQAGKSKAPPVATIDLQAMLPAVPEYEGTGRNLFAFGAERPADGLPPPEPRLVEPPPLVPPSPRPALTRRPSPAPSRIDVTYAGFLEKTRPDGAKTKYAIFLDGNEILAGAEGETVANRFTVVEIGLESVTVSAPGTNVTQRIPLQSK
jgi:hypothetical protein